MRGVVIKERDWCEKWELLSTKLQLTFSYLYTIPFLFCTPYTHYSLFKAMHAVVHHLSPFLISFRRFCFYLFYELQMCPLERIFHFLRTARSRMEWDLANRKDLWAHECACSLKIGSQSGRCGRALSWCRIYPILTRSLSLIRTFPVVFTD